MIKYIVYILLLILPHRLFAQQDIVKSKGIQSNFHRSNVGKILFSASSNSGLNEEAFINDYKLTNKSNLFITVFLANSLTNYLHQLEPSLNADTLVKLGNYQFSFYIDNKLVYQTNLLPGAPRAVDQNTETLWNKPLINNQQEWASWSQSAWNRFMVNGGDTALSEGQHILKIELRPYIKHNRINVGRVIASGELQLMVARKPVFNLDTINLTPDNDYDGLKVSDESFDQEKIRELKGYILENAFKNITSIAVLKEGKILIEEYFNGTSRDSLHDVRSVGKSFASTLFGIAKSEGHLKSEEQTLKEIYPLESYDNYTSEKGDISFKELLTMSSAFDGNDEDPKSPGNEENMYPTSDWVKFTLDLPLNTSKYKGQWHYFTSGVVLLGDILNKSVPGKLEQYAETKLFKPLNISKYRWEYTPQGVVNTAGGIRMNTLDFAKYGQLYKNGGRWNGKQVLAKEWVNKTFTRHEAIPGRNDEYYGYLFWNKKYVVKGKSYETFYCAGNGGNSIFIFKDEPLVVVVTATAFGAYYSHSQVDKMMEQYILPAVVN